MEPWELIASGPGPTIMSALFLGFMVYGLASFVVHVTQWIIRKVR